MNAAAPNILDDFATEAANFRRIVAAASERQWELETPSPGWTVRHQVAHLAFVFDLAATAASDAELFGKITAPVATVGFQAAVQQGVDVNSEGTIEDVLQRWDDSVGRVTTALSQLDPDTVVPWLVNPIPAGVLTAAGMLELFAHGQDVADTLGTYPERTDRIAHLVHFVYRTKDFGYQANELDPPNEEMRFEVQLPSGRRLMIGPSETDNVVVGPAVDLCLVAARRRHPSDTSLITTGAEATLWLNIAQAYRGPAGPGRVPRHATV